MTTFATRPSWRQGACETAPSQWPRPTAVIYYIILCLNFTANLLRLGDFVFIAKVPKFLFP